MKSILCSLAGLLFLPLSACATRSRAPAADSALDQIRIRYGAPALGAAYQTDVRSEYAVAGSRKVGDATPATVEDRFHLGSCTKAMTATLVARFVEVQQQSLDGKSNHWMHHARGNFGCWLQHEAPKRHPQMRQHKRWRLDHFVAVEQQVNIERAGGPTL